MDKDAKEVMDQVYSLTVGVDYDQPTSLESDLDALADLLIQQGFCCAGFKPSSKSGYLRDVLAAIPDANNQLDRALALSAEIGEMLGGIEYSGLEEADAGQLEAAVEELVAELESFFDADDD